MKEYPKIPTILKRDPITHHVLPGKYSIPEFDYLENNYWWFTEKIDGTNIRILWDRFFPECKNPSIEVRGKTDAAQIPPFLIAKLRQIFGERNLFVDKFGEEGDVCLYGEGYGNRIQKNGSKYISDGVDFILFDVKIGPWWLLRKDIEDIATYFDIKVVPIIGCGTLNEAIDITMDGFVSQWGDFIAEGMVLKPGAELFSRKGERILAKIKHKDFYRSS